MSNSIANVAEGLTYIGRKLLSNLKSRNLLVKRTNTSYLKGWAYGATFEIPDVDVSGPAATRAIGGAAVASDLVSLTRTFTKAQIYKGVRIDNLQLLFSSVDLMEKAAERLAYKVTKKADGIVAGLWNQVPYETGTLDGTSCWSPTATSDLFAPLNAALRILGENDADMIGGLTAVFNPREASIMRAIPGLYKANESGSTDMLRAAEIGNIMGFDVLWSQQIQNATLSSSSQTASPGAVVGAHAANAKTLVVNGLGTGTVKAGTTFSIAGLVNDEGYSVRFAVTTDATITSNAASLAIHPPLPSALAGSEAVSFTEHSAPGSMNLAFTRDAIATAWQGMANFMEGTGVAVSNIVDEQTGLSVQLAAESNVLGDAGIAYSTAITASLVFGAGIARPEQIIKITGQI